ncbi:MAG: DinB family protein [Actinobacteria bacterium]|nr:DinB family protein [Actinomycetota bacterium]
MDAPDPITQAKEYQEFLLAALGSDDPAEAQASTPGVMRELFREAGADLAAAPAPGEWSSLECAAHILGAELVSSGRYRWILAHDRPPLIGYDQDLWVKRLPQDRRDPVAMLELFEALRTANVRLWNGSTEDERARVGEHAERGPESFDLTFRMIAGHDRVHVAQARRALAAVRG